MYKFQFPLLLLCAILILSSCGGEKEPEKNLNAAAEGFNLIDSDQKAIGLADEVMEAMGGRKAWDTTRYLQWTFFGNRQHTWDKLNHQVRIESPSDSTLVIMNIKDKKGKAFKNGVALSGEDQTDLLEKGYRWWVNDSYWLVMPFKLKDSGVTLKYVGQDTTQTGEMSEVLSMSFDGVGVTPQNKYHVYISNEDKLVKQWDYFVTANDSTARFKSGWPEYKQYGDLLLSGGQIAGRKLTDINVSQTLSDATWSL